MKYLPRKLIREEINKVNPKLDFSVALSHNRFGFYEDKSYVIKVVYKKFKDTYCLLIPIRRDSIRKINKKTLREFLNCELSEVNKKFTSWALENS